VVGISPVSTRPSKRRSAPSAAKSKGMVPGSFKDRAGKRVTGRVEAKVQGVDGAAIRGGGVEADRSLVRHRGVEERAPTDALAGPVHGLKVPFVGAAERPLVMAAAVSAMGIQPRPSIDPRAEASKERRPRRDVSPRRTAAMPLAIINPCLVTARDADRPCDRCAYRCS
jgi:hypothetical protein